MIIVYIEWTFGLLNNTYISRDYYTNVHFSVNFLSLTNWLTLEYTQLIQEVIFLTVCWKKILILYEALITTSLWSVCMWDLKKTHMFYCLTFHKLIVFLFIYSCIPSPPPPPLPLPLYLFRAHGGLCFSSHWNSPKIFVSVENIYPY